MIRRDDPPNPAADEARIRDLIAAVEAAHDTQPYITHHPDAAAHYVAAAAELLRLSPAAAYALHVTLARGGSLTDERREDVVKRFLA